MGSVKGVFYRKMVLFAGLFLASVSSLWLTLFDFLNEGAGDQEG
jgi:type II secretory pathway component PulL